MLLAGSDPPAGTAIFETGFKVLQLLRFDPTPGTATLEPGFGMLPLRSPPRAGTAIFEAGFVVLLLGPSLAITTFEAGLGTLLLRPIPLAKTAFFGPGFGMLLLRFNPRAGTAGETFGMAWGGVGRTFAVVLYALAKAGILLTCSLLVLTWPLPGTAQLLASKAFAAVGVPAATILEAGAGNLVAGRTTGKRDDGREDILPKC